MFCNAYEVQYIKQHEYCMYSTVDVWRGIEIIAYFWCARSFGADWSASVGFGGASKKREMRARATCFVHTTDKRLAICSSEHCISISIPANYVMWITRNRESNYVHSTVTYIQVQ